MPHKVSPAFTVYVLGVFFVAASTLLFAVPKKNAPERAIADNNILWFKIISPAF